MKKWMDFASVVFGHKVQVILERCMSKTILAVETDKWPYADFHRPGWYGMHISENQLLVIELHVLPLQPAFTGKR